MMLDDRGVCLVHVRYIIRDPCCADLCRMIPRDMKILVQHIFCACNVLDGVHHNSSLSDEGGNTPPLSPPPSPPSFLTSGTTSTSIAAPP